MTYSVCYRYRTAISKSFGCSVSNFLLVIASSVNTVETVIKYYFTHKILYSYIIGLIIIIIITIGRQRIKNVQFFSTFHRADRTLSRTLTAHHF